MQQKWLDSFLHFLQYLQIDSKETGVTPLRNNLYGAQIRFLEEVCDGLDTGCRHFVILKARQLGISTISLAMDLFWLLVHPGMQGALVTDTDSNSNRFRIIIQRYFDSLPKEMLGDISIKKHNKDSLVLSNGSVLDYLVAGVKKGGTGLGRSRALNFLHATECSSYGDAEGVNSLMATLAEKHPNRLYIFESTAKGFNLFWEMWEAAKKDTHTQKPIFIGWWAKEDYSIPKEDSRFKEYWDGSIESDEERMIRRVKKAYGKDITPEQLTWFRWCSEVKITGEGMMAQEFPSYEEEAFLSTGTSFFPQKRIAGDMQAIRDNQVVFKAYRYHMGKEFLTTRIEPVTNSWEAELKIWQEPVENAEYVMGIDPAYGSNDNKDRHSIQVLRCYADCAVQVAEYASHNPETYQAAWVMAHLAGYYRRVILNLEIQGPGQAIMQEMRHLRLMMEKGAITVPANDAPIKDIKNLFSDVRWYLYHRPDSMGHGFVYNWQTTVNTKLTIMNQMRDAYVLEQFRPSSVMLLEEMQRVIQDGAQIAAEGTAKDDRVISAALANKAWLEWVRPGLITKNRTFEKVSLEEEKSKTAPGATLTGFIISSFYKEQAEKRHHNYIKSRWNNRRGRT